MKRKILILCLLVLIAVIGSTVPEPKKIIAKFCPLLTDHRLHLDLIMHAGLFASFTLCLAGLVRPALAVLIVLFFSTLLESLQGTTIVDRDFSFWDLVANIVGISIGIIIYQLYKKGRNERQLVGESVGR